MGDPLLGKVRQSDALRTGLSCRWDRVPRCGTFSTAFACRSDESGRLALLQMSNNSGIRRA